MISITSAQLSAWLAAFFFPFVRILALVASAPILGHRHITVHVKVGVAIMLTIIMAPTLDIPTNIDPASATGLIILLQQLLVGLAMGFVMRLIFAAVEMAGDISGMQMGLGFASFYDPQNATYTPVIAQFLGIIASLAFLSLDGHLYMLSALAESFHVFPIAANVPSASAMSVLLSWGGNIFVFALQLSLPLIAALMLTNLALGILTRSAPQLNIFAIGFPITLTVGFAALMLTLPYLAPLMENFIQAGHETMLRFARQLEHH